MSFLPGMTGALSGEGSRATLVYRDNDVNLTDGTSFTFSGKSIGTAATDRHVIVAVYWLAASSRTISSATIGGVAATIAVQGADTDGNGIIIAAVPTGTTADIIITLSGAADDMAIGWWTVTNPISATATATNTADDTDGTASVNLTIPSGGFAIAAATDASDATAITWTNADSRHESSLGGAIRYSGADKRTAGAWTISTTSNGNIQLVAAAWR